MRGIALSMIMMVLVPISFARPWIGILVWSWLGYMNPHRMTYGFARRFPWAQITALAILAGTPFSKDRKPFIWNRETILMLALWIWFVVTTVFAWYPDDAALALEETSKVFLMNFLTIPLMQERYRMRWLLLVIAGSLGFYGFKAGIFTMMTGGNFMVLGAQGRTSVSTNNGIALVLNMCLPIFWYLRKEETRTWLRHLLLATFVLSIIAVPFTYSRGGVLGLCFVLSVLFFRSRRRYFALPAAALGLVAIALLAPDKWTSRMQTLESYQTDRSAMGRITAWKVGIAIANDSPLVGGGFEVFNRPGAFQKYAPEFRHFIDAHSIYFNLLGEHGYVGLGLYLLLVLCTLARLRSLYRLGQRYQELAWVSDYSYMLFSSLLAYLFTGAFLSMAYLDLAWHLFALVVILQALAQQEFAALAPERVGAHGARPLAAGYAPLRPKQMPAATAG